MRKNKHKNLIFLGSTVLVLVTLACGNFQIGFLTATPEGVTQDIQETQPEAGPNDVSAITEQGTETTTTAPEEAALLHPTGLPVVAWLGHIASLPDGSQYDDMVVLSPEGTGEFGLTGSTLEIEAEILTLRDAEGPMSLFTFWARFIVLPKVPQRSMITTTASWW